MSLHINKPMSIDDFIDSKKFAAMCGLTKRQLDYRIRLRQVVPAPSLFGYKYIFDANAKILIPPPMKGGGRPKGSTIANGAKPPKYPENREIKRKIKGIKKSK